MSSTKDEEKNKIIHPRDEYDEHPGLRRSSLWAIAKSPLHFKWQEEHPKEYTDELSFGIAAHKYILEKDDFFNEFSLAPEVNRRTKSGREEWEAYQMLCTEENKTALSLADFNTIQAMDKAIDNHPFARRLLEGIHEKPFYWTDVKTGELCKCKPDCMTDTPDFLKTECRYEKLIVDYKTTRSCDVGKFEHSVKEYGYDLQVGMYTEGVFMNTFDEYGFAFVAQEKTPPYAVNVYVCSEDFINQGKETFHDLLGIYHTCKETNRYYGYEGPFGMVTVLEGRPM